MSELGPLTTASIYSADLAWIKQRQLKASGETSPPRWLTMPEMFHALIEAVQKSEAEGGA